jgi:hypothetical protein
LGTLKSPLDVSTVAVVGIRSTYTTEAMSATESASDRFGKTFINRLWTKRARLLRHPLLLRCRCSTASLLLLLLLQLLLRGGMRATLQFL